MSLSRQALESDPTRDNMQVLVAAGILKPDRRTTAWRSLSSHRLSKRSLYPDMSLVHQKARNPAGLRLLVCKHVRDRKTEAVDKGPDTISTTVDCNSCRSRPSCLPTEKRYGPELSWVGLKSLSMRLFRVCGKQDYG